MKIFDLKIVSKSKYEEAMQSLAKRIELEVQKENLLRRVKQLEAENKSLNTPRKFIDIKMGDPSPLDSTKRRSYVGQVAGLYKDVLEPKFKQMISVAHSLLEDETNTLQEDISLKGAIYAFWEIIRWGESMLNEQLGNQSNPDSSSDK